MAKEGSKRVEAIRLIDKQQITEFFAGSLLGNFFRVQLAYQGKTKKKYASLPLLYFLRNET